MKKRCSVPGCDAINPQNDPTITYFSFPKVTYNKQNKSQPNLISVRRLEAWKKACFVPADWNIKGMKVCARHFINGKPSRKMDMFDVDWVPSLELPVELTPEMYEDYYLNQTDGENLENNPQDDTETAVTEQNESNFFVDPTESNRLSAIDEAPSQTEKVLYVEIISENENNEHKQTAIIEEDESELSDLHQFSPARKKLKADTETQLSNIVNQDDEINLDLEDNQVELVDLLEMEREEDDGVEVITVSVNEDGIIQHPNEKVCQTEMTMKKIEELERFYAESIALERQSGRLRRNK